MKFSTDYRLVFQGDRCLMFIYLSQCIITFNMILSNGAQLVQLKKQSLFRRHYVWRKIKFKER